MIKSPWWLLLSLAWLALGVAAVMPVAMISMAFASPGAGQNEVLWVLFGSALFFPVSCLLGAVLPWLFRRKRHAWKLFLIPVASFAFTALVALLPIF